MPGSKSSMNISMKNKGFVIITDEQITPQIVPTPSDMCGFETTEHLLYVFAIDVIYKFDCEDFDTSNFDGTRKFISAYYQGGMMKTKPWFKSIERKLFDTNPQLFWQSFKQSLINDLDSYYGECAKDLVDKMKNEIRKLEL